jgi:hypothetical protein
VAAREFILVQGMDRDIAAQRIEPADPQATA